jgi:hypothetical protein
MNNIIMAFEHCFNDMSVIFNDKKGRNRILTCVNDQVFHKIVSNIVVD